MGWNIGLGVLKEFLPDMLRPLTKNRKTSGSDWKTRDEDFFRRIPESSRP